MRVLAARLIIAILCCLSHRLAADDVFEGLTPGLIGRYGSGEFIRSRVDRDIAFEWGQASASPEDARTPISAEWSGVMLVRSETAYRFSAFAQGQVTVVIDGQTVLEASADTPGWLHGPETPLAFGFLPITITFHGAAEGAVCKLFWASPQFPLEPLPQHLLFHEADDAATRLVERGRVLFDAHRCNRCHVRGDTLPSNEAPPFIAVAADINPDWITAKLRHQNPEAADAKMPVYGYSQEEATAIGAWLWAINQPPRIAPLRPAEADKKSPPPDGLMLIRSLGCLACHKLGELGTTGPYGGGDLSHIGAKRTGDWIYTWLFQPDRINPERSMPQFQLSPTERSQIAAALAELGRTPEMTYERPRFEEQTVVVQQGRDLVRKARCYNCHKTPAVDNDVRGLPKLDRPITDWERTCLAEENDPEHVRPSYPQADRAALKAYVDAITRPPRDAQDLRSPAERLGPFNHGRLVLERRNCLACHERDGAKGIVETAGLAATSDPHLRGLSEALIPPNLTAVGDKLQDAALAKAVEGDPDKVRLPWLKVRMPKFKHTDEERAALVGYLIGHDRIPAADSVPAAANASVAEAAPVDSETLLLGRQLVGAGGFSCTACHSVGDYEPRNTALGTRGSDLKGMGNRIREEFYYRWTRAPLRIVPGMEMPSYEERPVKGVLDGDVHAQLAALWKASNDPRFEAPTNPSQVEQLLTVQPGEPPRILRDVFTVSKENGGGYVARSFAMGFDNGHSILFDLDHACVRDWTFGDFARQRTEGKSWYWDLAGSPVVSGLTARGEFVLQLGNEWIQLGDPTNGSAVQLIDYAVASGGTPEVRLTYRLIVRGGEGGYFHVTDRWSVAAPTDQSPRRCLTRSLSLEAGTPGRLWLVPSATQSLLLGSGPETGAGWQPCGELGLGLPVEPEATVHYLADPAAAPAEPPQPPQIPLNAARVTTAPGFEGVRLPLPTSIMPTAIAIKSSGELGVSSLKGQVFVLHDRDGDGLHEVATEFEQGLAAPFGLVPADSGAEGGHGDAPSVSEWLVVHKPELVALADIDGNGRADQRRVVFSGWGYTDNYHDWSAGPVRDSAGNLYVATSSDYAQPGRPEELCQQRGKMLRIAPDGTSTVTAHELRYPMGIAFDPQGRLFVSDQQGVANCFNEINHIVEGRRYGVKGLYDPESDAPEQRAAVQIPHPWTRSVNGIFFIPDAARVQSPVSSVQSNNGLPETSPAVDAGPSTLNSQLPVLNPVLAPFAGHGIGCEYNGRFLIRFSLQDIGGELQGAVYPFTRGTWDNEAETFLGPMCGAVAHNGDLYIGSIHDSGWLGGMNTGEIVRLRPTGDWPNGIRELRATPDGFELEFLHPVDPFAAGKATNYALSGYTRVWKGSYATEDSGRYEPRIQSVDVSADARIVRLHVDRLESSFVYDVAVKSISADGQLLFPDIGHYTMNRVPQGE